jgi:hypothetical protein
MIKLGAKNKLFTSHFLTIFTQDTKNIVSPPKDKKPRRRPKTKGISIFVPSGR